jgi:hypothetical protein
MNEKKKKERKKERKKRRKKKNVSMCKVISPVL